MSLQFGKKIEDLNGQPYKDPVFNKVYNQFFCDDLEVFRNSVAEQTPPWSILLAKQRAPADLQAIIDEGAIESRAKIFAHRELQSGGDHLYGAVVEVSLDKTLNVVAAYRDGSARAINAGRIIDWEDLEDVEIREAIVTFLSAAQFAAVNLERWTKPRLPFPNRGLVRFSILTSDAFYFGQGNMEKMLKDPVGQPVVEAAMDLMMKLSMKAK